MDELPRGYYDWDTHEWIEGPTPQEKGQAEAIKQHIDKLLNWEEPGFCDYED